MFWNFRGQHYYWEMASDLVSWLPPGHPKCQISQPASQLREELHLKDGDQDDNMSSEESGSDPEIEVNRNAPIHSNIVPSLFLRSINLSLQTDETEAKKDRKIETRERYKSDRRIQREKDKTALPLDPMDPASYSDIPR